MANTATVTGTTGAGQAVTALVLNDVQSVLFDLVASIVKITYMPNMTPVTLDIMYSNLATVTWTISGSSATITLST